MSKTRFYRIWKGIIYRCNNKNNISFKNYGKNGIKVCDRWLKFINFKDDMYKDYIKYAKKFGEKNTTIDRINNNDNYKLSNCRWANWKIQGNNRKNTQFLIYKNKKKPLAQWAREFNISRHVLRIRILKLKWPIKKALITN